MHVCASCVCLVPVEWVGSFETGVAVGCEPSHSPVSGEVGAWVTRVLSPAPDLITERLSFLRNSVHLALVPSWLTVRTVDSTVFWPIAFPHSTQLVTFLRPSIFWSGAFRLNPDSFTMWSSEGQQSDGWWMEFVSLLLSPPCFQAAPAILLATFKTALISSKSGSDGLQTWGQKTHWLQEYK